MESIQGAHIWNCSYTKITYCLLNSHKKLINAHTTAQQTSYHLHTQHKIIGNDIFLYY